MSAHLRSSVPRLVTLSCRRYFSVAPARHADLIQGLYLKELSAYKPPVRSAKDSEGQVKHYVQPQPPQHPPLFPEDQSALNKEIANYIEQPVEIETAPPAAVNEEVAEQSAGIAEGEDWFVAEDIQDGGH